jgi:uncharacterized membrane protein YphA (DoxX/SURF4 family)
MAGAGGKMQMALRKRATELMKKKALQIALRWGLGAIFIYASVPKLLDPVGFGIVVNNYQILPNKMVYPVAAFLPYIELILGLFLILGVARTGVILLSVVFFFIFLFALVLNLIRGLNIDCGCFHVESGEVSKIMMYWYVIRDLFLLTWALLLFRFEAKTKGNRDV